MLGGYCGEPISICGHEANRNGGAAARAAANRRLPVVTAASRQMPARVGLVDRSESGEESGEEPEGGDPNGGAAACAAAMVELEVLYERHRRLISETQDVNERISELQQTVNNQWDQQEQDSMSVSSREQLSDDQEAVTAGAGWTERHCH